ncbi:MAG: ABC transporter permease [candidate division KSB1 bacterium]|nr:ABC transporter permease [candidate division KSB1 bacterium]
MAIFSVAFALVIVGLFAIVYVNLGQVVEGLRARVEIEAFLSPDLSDEEIHQLEEHIRSLEGVEAVTFVSRERAALEFRQAFGEDVVAILDDNPLPASFRIRPSAGYRTGDAARQIVERVQALPGVEEVLYRGDLLRLLDRYVRAALLGGAVIGATLVIGAVLLVYNTLRLVAMSQAQVIEIMRLVGATRRFIRRPFVVHGTLEGFLGGVVGCGVLWALVRIGRIEIPNLVEVSAQWYSGVIAAGVLLGWSGSRLAVGKYLK